MWRLKQLIDIEMGHKTKFVVRRERFNFPYAYLIMRIMTTYVSLFPSFPIYKKLFGFVFSSLIVEKTFRGFAETLSFLLDFLSYFLEA